MNTGLLTVRRILVTGATGKVGRHFLAKLQADEKFLQDQFRALCHQRTLSSAPRLAVLQGNLSEREVARSAMDGITHIVHLATCKETPEDIMDVAIKGLFWLLEEARVSPSFRQFLLVGGDAGIGHFHYPHPLPITERQKRSAYPGCYALSKVLEEVMLEQYSLQYDLNGCCLRAPWIMEKDDFRMQLSFGEDVFGAPRWRDLVGPERASAYASKGTIPLMLDANGQAMKRNFVHVSDLVEAIALAIDHPRARQQLFHIGMDEPVDYGQVAKHLHQTRGLPSIEIPTPYHSTWLDNAKAKFLLGWRPHYDLARLIDEAYAYERASDDPRLIHYPG